MRVEVPGLFGHGSGAKVQVFDALEPQLLLQALKDEHFGHAEAKRCQVTLLLRKRVLLAQLHGPLVDRLVTRTPLGQGILDKTLPFFVDARHCDQISRLNNLHHFV